MAPAFWMHFLHDHVCAGCQIIPRHAVTSGDRWYLKHWIEKITFLFSAQLAFLHCLKLKDFRPRKVTQKMGAAYIYSRYRTCCETSLCNKSSGKRLLSLGWKVLCICKASVEAILQWVVSTNNTLTCSICYICLQITSQKAVLEKHCKCQGKHSAFGSSRTHLTEHKTTTTASFNLTSSPWIHFPVSGANFQEAIHLSSCSHLHQPAAEQPITLRQLQQAAKITSSNHIPGVWRKVVGTALHV